MKSVEKIKTSVYDLEGNPIKEIEISDCFDCEIKKKLLREVIEYQNNVARAGTYGTKGRGDLQFSTKKRRQQKKSGRARMGASSAPHLRKGAVAFGPSTIYNQKIPKKKIALALKMTIWDKISNGQFVVFNNFSLEKPNTKKFVNLVEKIKAENGLFVDVNKNENFSLSLRNVIGFDFLPAIGMNPLSVLKKKMLVVSEEALDFLTTKFSKVEKEYEYVFKKKEVSFVSIICEEMVKVLNESFKKPFKNFAKKKSIINKNLKEVLKNDSLDGDLLETMNKDFVPEGVNSDIVNSFIDEMMNNFVPSDMDETGKSNLRLTILKIVKILWIYRIILIKEPMEDDIKKVISEVIKANGLVKDKKDACKFGSNLGHAITKAFVDNVTKEVL